MGFFDFLKSNEDESGAKNAVPWKRLHSLEQLDDITKTSGTRPVAIFKHSTRCGISRMVLRQFEGSYDVPEDKMDLYYLDLLSYRDISDAIGTRFQVWHESPQLIVVHNGVAVAHASHHGIRAAELHNFV